MTLTVAWILLTGWWLGENQVSQVVAFGIEWQDDAGWSSCMKEVTFLAWCHNWPLTRNTHYSASNCNESGSLDASFWFCIFGKVWGFGRWGPLNGSKALVTRYASWLHDGMVDAASLTWSESHFVVGHGWQKLKWTDPRKQSHSLSQFDSEYIVWSYSHSLSWFCCHHDIIPTSSIWH